MSVRKFCGNCAHGIDGFCEYGMHEILSDPNNCPQWTISGKIKADLLHDAEPEHEADLVEVLLNRAKNKPKHDAVSHPAHYISGGIECIDCIKAALGEYFMGFLIGNVIKYTYRYKDKNGVEDLKKGMKYLEWAIKELENDKVD